ncbi:MAG: hypothetical protein ACK42D_00890 [Candidatus Paceibacteria bacterium]
MFLRSLLTTLVCWLGATNHTSADIYTIVAVDVSGSVPSVVLQEEACPSIRCGQSFIEAQQLAFVQALSALADPQCSSQSHLMVAQWSSRLSPLSSWLSLSTASDRARTVRQLEILNFRPSGRTLHRRAFEEALLLLNQVYPTRGMIVIITDDGVRSDGWVMGQEGYGLAEEQGYEYVEIVLSGRDTIQSLARELSEIFKGLHSSPFLCLG